MKVVIIILVLIVIGFVVAIGVAVYRATTPPAPPSAHGPPMANGKIDEDALATWDPPPMASVMGRLSRPFAPKLLKETVQLTGQPSSGLGGDKPGELSIALSDKKMRIARLRLVEGRGAVATYDCEAREDGETCDQVACLCHEDTVLGEDDVEACEEPWRKARAIGDDKFRCRKDDDDVSAVIYRQGGKILVAPMGDNPATVSIR